MGSTHDMAKLEEEFNSNKKMLNIFTAVFILGIAFAAMSQSGSSVVFITLAFIGFLNAGIQTEMSERKLDPHAH